MDALEHQQEHIRLHRAFDQLLACYLNENLGLPGAQRLDHTPRRIGIDTPVMHLLSWSHQKTMVPTPTGEDAREHPRSVDDFEAQRQTILLALATLALSRPHLEAEIKEIARFYDATDLPTYEGLKTAVQSPRLKEVHP